jgi:hypothetical protein
MNRSVQHRWPANRLNPMKGGEKFTLHNPPVFCYKLSQSMMPHADNMTKPRWFRIVTHLGRALRRIHCAGSERLTTHDSHRHPSFTKALELSIVKTESRCDALLILAFVWIIYIGGQSQAHAQDKTNSYHLARLVTEFLKSANHSVFVSFNRQILHPRQTIANSRHTLANGSTAEITLWDSNYFAFFRSGAEFLIAHSASQPLLQYSDVMMADKLIGFDGEYYWSLDLKKPVQLLLAGTGGTNVEAPQTTLSFNTLALVPAQEAQRKLGEFTADVKLASILGMQHECTAVAQLGFSELLDPHVRKTAGSIALKTSFGKIVSARILGESNRPDKVEYVLDESSSALATELDYSQNAITVNKTAGGDLFLRTQYKILIVDYPGILRDKTIFSWRKYREDAGDLISTVTEKGNTHQISIGERGAIQPEGALIKVAPRSRKFALAIFVILSLTATVAVIWLARTKQTLKKPTK